MFKLVSKLIITAFKTESVGIFGFGSRICFGAGSVSCGGANE